MIDKKKLRAWWFRKQGLDGSLKNTGVAEVLQKTGWARSVGGVNPYITLFARAGISRDAADAALAKIEIHELPAARGCTYVLPVSDFALGSARRPPTPSNSGRRDASGSRYGAHELFKESTSA